MNAPANLSSSNAALIDLRDWLLAQREAGRTALESEADSRKIALVQGRIGLVSELLRMTDPAHPRYGT